MNALSAPVIRQLVISTALLSNVHLEYLFVVHEASCPHGAEQRTGTLMFTWKFILTRALEPHLAAVPRESVHKRMEIVRNLFRLAADNSPRSPKKSVYFMPTFQRGPRRTES